jgi:hypothetical protein
LLCIVVSCETNIWQVKHKNEFFIVNYVFFTKLLRTRRVTSDWCLFSRVVNVFYNDHNMNKPIKNPNSLAIINQSISVPLVFKGFMCPLLPSTVILFLFN